MNNEFLRSLFRPFPLAVMACAAMSCVLVQLHIKFPNDGVYYEALADGFLTTSRLCNWIFDSCPPPITRQHGAALVIAFLKFLFSDLWMVAYSVLITVLWWLFAAVILQGISKSCLTVKNTLYENQMLFALAGLFFLNHSFFTVIGGGYNEAFGMPLMWMASLVFITHLEGQGRIISKRLIGLLVICITTAVFFRVQAVCYALSFALILARRSLWPFSLLCLICPITVVVALRILTPVATEDEYLRQALTLYSSMDDIVLKILSYFASPFSIFGWPSIVFERSFPASTAFIGFLVLFPLILGLFSVYRRRQETALFVIFLILFNILFLLIIPIRDHRYEFFASFPIFFLLVEFVSCAAKMLNKTVLRGALLAYSALFLVTVLIGGNYLFNYFTTVNNTHYRKIVINGDWEGVDSGEKHDLVARAIIYSPSPRFVYWYLNKRVCDATPDQCGGDFLPKERLQVLFIGEQTAIVDHLAQFNVSNFSATQIAGAKAGFGVHRISW